MVPLLDRLAERGRQLDSTSLDTGERSVIAEGGLPPPLGKAYRQPRRLYPKDHLIQILTEAGFEEKAAQVALCYSDFRALMCQNGHVVEPIPTYKCGFRLCGDCARVRQVKAYQRLYPRLEEFRRRHPGDRPVLITLTAKSSFDPLYGVAQQFKEWVRRLRRSKKWKACIRGGLVSYEITWSAEYGWHFHAHILAFRQAWWEQAELAAQWAAITEGAGQIVDIRAVQDFGGAVREVLKYVYKPSDVEQWGPQQVAEFMELKGIKLSECYGELRGLKVESGEDLDGEAAPAELREGSLCPHCQKPLKVVRLTREFFYNTS
jgi:hypothetical protein